MKNFMIRLYHKLMMKIHFYRNDIVISPGSFINPSCNIGEGTRINAISYIDSCDIGRYCAIAGRLSIRVSNHFTNYINMQGHFQYDILSSKVKVTGHIKKRVRIGDGVWIGDGVTILPNVQIGDGAVIGAGSVVTKSIPAYAIAVGNPARVIKYRFNEDIIDVLLKYKPLKKNKKDLKRMKEIFELDMRKVNTEELIKRFEEL